MLTGPASIEFFARVAAQAEKPIVPSPPWRSYYRYLMRGRLVRAFLSLPLCFGSIRCSIRSGVIRVSKTRCLAGAGRQLTTDQRQTVICCYEFGYSQAILRRYCYGLVTTGA